MSTKGPGDAPTYDGTPLRIGILHARWNTPIVTSLVQGAVAALAAAGVAPGNIVTQSVPGSWELPFGVQRMWTASQTRGGGGSLVSAATDLLSGGGGAEGEVGGGAAEEGGPLDAIVAIGVLVKGSTMHFEYIADAVSHGIMKVQLESGVPVVFGLLTCLDEEQARTRAGLGKGKGEGYGEQGHNHGEDWGRAAVEMGVKRRGWGEGRFV